MEVIDERENSLLNRKEIKVVVEAEKNPSYEEAVNIIAEKFRADKDVIVIKKVIGKFGRHTFLINSFIYNSKEDLEKIEPKKKVKEGEKKEETPAPPQPEQKTEQKPVEKKEEKVEEK